jgi:cysteine desulfurase
MLAKPIYLDNHATTRLDPRVLQAMLPFFDEQFGNAGSVSHVFGWDARKAVDDARQRVAQAIGATERDIVFTSGATESNNLALRGLAEVTLLAVEPATSPQAGWLDPQQVAAALRDDTLLVSVMLANNEIGILQPVAEIARLCREREVLVHCDATQAVGKTPVDADQLGVDLLSFSAHKIYGPKGVGGLYVRRAGGRVRLEPQIDGGGQEGGFRSGTLNVPGIVGLATALELCLATQDQENQRLSELRDRLFAGLQREVPDVHLNGPALTSPQLRLAGNLNLAFPLVDGEALMMSMRDVAVSSGSACTSANPEPSHVLRALGLNDDLVRASLRFGLGRFNTVEEIDFTIGAVAESVQRLRRLSSAASGKT